ncbi:hypothetical protein ACLOJK_001462 [Asimina triloba]
MSGYASALRASSVRDKREVGRHIYDTTKDLRPLAKSDTCLTRPRLMKAPVVSGSRLMDADLPAIRRKMIERLLSYFKRQPKYYYWQERVPAAVRKIEQKLFMGSVSKEEYMDLRTFEHRLHHIISFILANGKFPTTSNAVPSSPVVRKRLKASVPRRYGTKQASAESPFQAIASVERDWGTTDSEASSTHMPFQDNNPATLLKPSSQGMMEPQITPEQILHQKNIPAVELALQKCSPCMTESETRPPLQGLCQREQPSPSESLPDSHQSKAAVEENISRRSMFTAVSLTESFTAEQIREHIQSLRQSKLEAGKVQVIGNSMDENSCTLCGEQQLWLEPPPVFCSLSNDRIKCNEVFYTGDHYEGQFYICRMCHSRQSKIFKVQGVSILKAHLKKQKNLSQIGETRNLGEETRYTCPNCYLREIETGERERRPLLKYTFLGARDLPSTALSNHIEDHLFRKLKAERQQRANQLGKNFDVVEGAEGLVLREVACIEKKVKLEGVDVCLFAMHTEEFGSDRPLPNKGRVYLSYFDSVRYFGPEIKLVNGEALRTFVYQEFLMQKLPRSSQLRKWYETVLKKAIDDGIVAERTNAFNSFFKSSAKCKATAARLPYFEGDYFPDLIEETLYFLQNEMENQKEERRGRKRTSGGKEKGNLIIANLQHSCAPRGQFIASGKRLLKCTVDYHCE